MSSTIILSCIIVQTAIGIYLLNIRRIRDDFEKNINILLILLLCHLSSKLFLLVILKNSYLYSRVASGFSLSYGPLLYVICRFLIQKPVSRKQLYLHMLPFLIFSLMYFVFIAALSFRWIGHDFIAQYTTAFYKYVAATSLLIYPALIKWMIHEFMTNDALLKSRLKLVNQVATVLLVGIFSGLFFAFTNLMKFSIPDFDLRLVPYICYAVIPVLVLKYKIQEATSLPSVIEHSIFPPNHDQTATILNKEEHRYQKSSLDESAMNEYEQKLKEFMAKSKIFLDSELSLDTFSLSLKIPKHHLTQLLNDRFKRNFYAFINEYRIEEAINRLKHHQQNENILSLAYDCGFNSKSSFNSYFKKVTGKTPTEFRKEMMKNERA